MLCAVKVEAVGDTALLPGDVLDRVVFAAANERLTGCVKVLQRGDSWLAPGAVVAEEEAERQRAWLAAQGRTPPTVGAPAPATAAPCLLGISQVPRVAPGFLAALTAAGPARVLERAALAGTVDALAGLKENVLLGRLIPAGTGYPALRQADVRTEIV
jgi:DNA-directed RNA polymerase subunit beta'